MRNDAIALRDYTIDREVWRVLVLSVLVGAGAGGIALGLVDLIGFFTHLAYDGDVGDSLVAPSLHHWGAAAAAVPVVGGLAVGLIAWKGSDRVRGHGIPEAMEAILVGGSKVQPRLTVFKPVASAIAIGTGGPFGAEGPIILSGGAFGSLLAQFFRMSAHERRTLLCAGACAGMAAVFGTPAAAVLFGVELLVLEVRPRSLVPISFAVVTASGVRSELAGHHLLSALPLFPTPAHGTFSNLELLAAAGVGVVAAALSFLSTHAVYAAEDLFKRLPIHWAWWPAIGGIVIGLGGLIEPRALGVGYSTIDAALAGHLVLRTLAAVLVIKLVIWAVGLGSGTSAGVVAPILILGSTLGGLLAPVLPGQSSAAWALVGMAAVFAGMTGSPLTAVVFSLELTHDVGILLPAVAACAVAHLVCTMTLKRSILTEKVARRGFHITREYGIEPLEALYVRETMLTDLLTADRDQPVRELHAALVGHPEYRRQRLYPVTDDGDRLLGAVPGTDLLVAAASGHGDRTADELAVPVSDLVVAHPDETLRMVADRMAEHALGSLPVVDRRRPGELVGIVTEFDLLKARQRELEEERHRERVLWIRRSTTDRQGHMDIEAPQVTSARTVVDGEDPGPQAPRTWRSHRRGTSERDHLSTGDQDQREVAAARTSHKEEP